MELTYWEADILRLEAGDDWVNGKLQVLVGLSAVGRSHGCFDVTK